MSIPKLKYFIQCDEVRNENGKFSAIGFFDTIFSLIFPATHKRFFVMLGFVGEAGRYDLELQIAAPDRNLLARATGELSMPGESQVGNVVFALDNFPLPMAGKYMMSVFLDGDFLAEHPFFVRPPFERRERTPDEIALLLARPDIVKSANCDVSCDKCKTAYRFQHHLDPGASLEPGFLSLPPGDYFACAVCGRHIPITQLRGNLQNLVGIPRQWLEGGGPPATPDGAPEPPSAEKEQ